MTMMTTTSTTDPASLTHFHYTTTQRFSRRKTIIIFVCLLLCTVHTSSRNVRVPPAPDSLFLSRPTAYTKTLQREPQLRSLTGPRRAACLPLAQNSVPCSISRLLCVRLCGGGVVPRDWSNAYRLAASRG